MMSAKSPLAVGARGGDAELRPVTHRTKHRKEVKRYYQRQQNKQLREEAKARDAQLFLFERNSNAAAEDTDVMADKKGTAAPITAAKTTAAKHKLVKGPEAVKAITGSGSAGNDATATAPIEAAAAPQTDQMTLPLQVPPASNWDFEFVLRRPISALDGAVTAGSGASTASMMDGALQQRALVSGSASPFPPVSPMSLVAASRLRPRDFASSLDDSDNRGAAVAAAGAGEGRSGPSGTSEPISVLPIDTAVAGSVTKLLNNAHVQRVEGAPAIPMEAPLSGGTDLNRPPRNYLTLDPLYNVHQHAPGFVRDQQIALQHMLATAMANWKDMQQNALIVTSAEALRTIFEQVYVPSRPLALRVRRIGPTIVIDSQASEPSQVQEMRQQALFSKALYLMTETHGREVPAEVEAAAAQMAVTLPERRLCSVAASNPANLGVNLHRYSQLLRWRIDSTELLVGNDAPVVVDRRTGTEQLVRLKAADQTDSTDSQQRATLQCWFDAMLANVSHVGTYLHCDGTVLSYQVKKTNDLLGYVEGRMAGAALNFTSTTLQWLVKHCQRDGGTYAMLRDFSTDYLKLYELPELDESGVFVAETGQHFSKSPAPANAPSRGGASNSGGNGCGSHSHNSRQSAEGPYASYPSNAPHLNHFSLNFGRTCFHIGQHLYLEGGVGRANDALTLLHRSLRVFLPCCVTEAVARETVAEVVQMLPALVSRKMRADANSKAAAAASSSNNNGGGGGNNNSFTSNNASDVGYNGLAAYCRIGDDGGRGCFTSKTPVGFVTASCSSPELYRDALVLCGRFEIPLRRAFVEAGGSDGDPLMQAFYARCLVASSAAVCSVVATSLEAYYCGCHHLRVMRRARSEAKSKDNKSTTAFRGVDYREDLMAVLASMIQDLMQVVVEGLVHLEETSALISPLHAAEVASTTTAKASTSSTAIHRSINASSSGASGVWTVPASVLQASAAVTGASNAKGAKEELSLAGHSSSSASSDGVLSTTCSVHGEGEADSSGDLRSHRHRTSSPARVAVKAAVPCGTVLDPRTQVDTTPLRSALCELYGDVVMIAMADAASGFTTRTLAELGARLEARAQDTAGQLPTTLLWLTSLKADVVSLSFTALRFYGRVASHTRRHLAKLAQVYYVVGKEHHRTARYTKALEALHRAKSLLQASHKAPEDTAFGDAFGSHGLMQWADVMLLLGDVYRSVVERKLEAALGVAAATVSQPLLVGPLHDLPAEADTFFAQAINAYKQGGQDESCKAAKACTLLIYASVLMERIAIVGEPASHADSQRIAELLRDAESLAPDLYVEERDWQTVRLFTVTSPTAADTALTRSVENIVRRYSCCLLPTQRGGGSGTATDGALELKRESLWVDTDVADCGVRRRERLVMLPSCAMLAEMQKALVCCVMVERLAAPSASSSSSLSAAAAVSSGSASPSSLAALRTRQTTKPSTPATMSESKYRSMLRWVGRASAFLTRVMHIFLESKDLWRTAAARHQWMSTLHTWGKQTLDSCLHQTVCLIALRLLNAAQGSLPSSKQIEAREAFKQVTRRLEEGASASGDTDEAHELISKSLKELCACLTPFIEW